MRCFFLQDDYTRFFGYHIIALHLLRIMHKISLKVKTKQKEQHEHKRGEINLPYDDQACICKLLLLMLMGFNIGKEKGLCEEAYKSDIGSGSS